MYRYLGLESTESSLQEELTQAEVWKLQLEHQIIRSKEMLKPPVMKFIEQLDADKAVSEKVIDAIFGDEDINVDEVVRILRRKALETDKLGRNELIEFIKTVLNVRNQIVNSENLTGGADEVVERLAAEILFQLGRPGIDWTGMKEDQLRTVRSSSSHSIAFQFGFIIIFSSGNWLLKK